MGMVKTENKDNAWRGANRIIKTGIFSLLLVRGLVDFGGLFCHVAFVFGVKAVSWNLDYGYKL